MMRFRNLTGGQFDSAASHLYQKHDVLVSKFYAIASVPMRFRQTDLLLNSTFQPNVFHVY